MRALHHEGASIVYLTGRDQPRMEKCTREGLLLHRFPLGARVHLMMKPNKDLADLDFKKEAMARISALGEVVAGFENEPANVNLLKNAFPAASMVFLDTAHSNKPDQPQPGIPWIRDFRRH